MKHPFLIGQNIYIRSLREDDLEGNYIQWLNDSEVCKYNSHHTFPYSEGSAEAYIKSTFNSQNALVLAIVLQENDLHIGNVALQNIDFVSRSAEFAILIGEKDYWGKGYSKEAALLVLSHGFMELNLHRIYCGTSIENIPMQRLAIYLGMIEEGRKREALFKHGRYIDTIEYSVLKDEFVKRLGN
ncbi:MAG TPA: GNAT family N-acetyltransferase [Candidatus Aquicultor sp.]|jgi:RimJ/RimL family protein N-acetyltransferase